MNAQKEAFEFDLNTFFRLERTKRPSVSLAIYAELLASMMVQDSRTIDCEMRFLSKTLKVGNRTLAETLDEFRSMGLIKYIPVKGMGKKRLIKLLKEGK